MGDGGDSEKKPASPNPLVTMHSEELALEDRQAFARKVHETRLEVQAEQIRAERDFESATRDLDQVVRIADDLQSQKGIRRAFSLSGTYKSASGKTDVTVRGGNCFIATAVYGDPHAPEVERFRTIRDRYLMPSFVGRAFIRCYYLIGPYLALLPRDMPFVRRTLRYVFNVYLRYSERRTTSAPR
jgi:hypothetical protein